MGAGEVKCSSLELIQTQIQHWNKLPSFRIILALGNEEAQDEEWFASGIGPPRRTTVVHDAPESPGQDHIGVSGACTGAEAMLTLEVQAASEDLARIHDPTVSGSVVCALTRNHVEVPLIHAPADCKERGRSFGSDINDCGCT
ncbi:hypothetical protein STEG23_005882, partial [Scotinomys teguina]